jgi:Protein of unknown function (DUF1488)
MLDFQRRLKRRTPVMLSFPNQSRVYDPTRRAVRFWGYESAMEWSFFVTDDALKHMQPDLPRDEADLLKVFDSNRQLIHAAASKAFSRTRKGSYELTTSDF